MRMVRYKFALSDGREGFLEIGADEDASAETIEKTAAAAMEAAVSELGCREGELFTGSDLQRVWE